MLQNPTIPDDLKEALEEIGAVATVDEMPLGYRRWLFLFIEQAGDVSTRGFRVDNFMEVVKFFKQDSEDARDPDRSL